MTTKTFNTLPPDAVKIREDVFVREQGFVNEFDDIDEVATHVVLYDRAKAVATCRIYKETAESAGTDQYDTGTKGHGTLHTDYILGRIAVIKDYRGRSLGAYIISEAEKEIKKLGGKRVIVHAQSRVQSFYEKQGYADMGKTDLDENCPHVWMLKQL